MGLTIGNTGDLEGDVLESPGVSIADLRSLNVRTIDIVIKGQDALKAVVIGIDGSIFSDFEAMFRLVRPLL